MNFEAVNFKTSHAFRAYYLVGVNVLFGYFFYSVASNVASGQCALCVVAISFVRTNCKFISFNTNVIDSIFTKDFLLL